MLRLLGSRLPGAAAAGALRSSGSEGGGNFIRRVTASSSHATCMSCSAAPLHTHAVAHFHPQPNALASHSSPQPHSDREDTSLMMEEEDEQEQQTRTQQQQRAQMQQRAQQEHRAAHDREEGSADLHRFGNARGKWYELEFVFGGPTRPFGILHKPAGLGVQGRYQADSVEKRLKVGYGASEVYFPHRLDKHTAGLLVVAFSKTASRALGASLEAGQWEKRYRAMVVVPPAVDMEFQPHSEDEIIPQPQQRPPEQLHADDAEQPDDDSPSISDSESRSLATPPTLPFTHRFPSRMYPASALLSSYLTGSLWGAHPLPDVDAPALKSKDYAAQAVPVRIFLRKQAILRSWIGRRKLPLYHAIDEQHEWGKWNRAVQACPANKAPPAPSSDRALHAAALSTGAFLASSPSKDGLAYHSSAALDRRRLHPFVPETMLYESVPFRPLDKSTQDSGHDGNDAAQGKRKQRKRGEEEPSEDIDEAELDAAEELAGVRGSSSAGGDPPKKAMSTFTLLRTCPSRRLALYDVQLGTGRSHQIRVHCADAGCPVLHDPYYNQYSVSAHMRRAARIRTEDAVARAMSKQRAHAGKIIPLDEIAAAADEVERRAANAGYPPAPVEGEGAVAVRILPPPALEPMQMPLLPVRPGAGVTHEQRLRSGARVTLTKGTLPATNSKKGGAADNSGENGEPSAGWQAASRERARKKRERVPHKYAVRSPRRNFTTQTRLFMASYMRPLLANSPYYSSRESEGGGTSGEQAGSEGGASSGGSAPKQRWEPDGKFKRRARPAPRSSGFDETDAAMPQGRSSVGQGGGSSGSYRRAPTSSEHDEFDDPSERRVLPRDSYAGTSRRSPSTSPSKRAAAAAEREEAENSKLFEHKMAYGGRGKPRKTTPTRAAREEQQEEQQRRGGHREQSAQTARSGGGFTGGSQRYTNRHDAPKRPHWLPEHVPYKLVRPNPAVAQQWESVLQGYGVGKHKEQEDKEEEQRRAEGEQPLSEWSAAQRYANMERGAGAVGWLVKAESPFSSSGAPELLLPSASPVPASDASAAASGEHHWFAREVAQPQHEMGLQAYFLRLPHPTRPGEIITIEQSMPKAWSKLMLIEETKRKQGKGNATAAAPCEQGELQQQQQTQEAPQDAAAGTAESKA